MTQRAKRAGVAVLVLLVAYLACAAVLATVVLVQGLPRGVEAQASASAEAHAFDLVAGIGFVVAGVLSVVSGVLITSGESHERLSRRQRVAVVTLSWIAVVLGLAVFAVGGAMGWHDLGFAG